MFLKLPREKTVKYFSNPMIPRDIKPKISQTKKPELSVIPVAWVILPEKYELLKKRGYTYGAHCTNLVFNRDVQIQNLLVSGTVA